MPNKNRKVNNNLRVIDNETDSGNWKLDAVLNAVYSEYEREVVMGNAEKVVVTIWTVASYVAQGFKLFPILSVTSVGPEAGKSTLLHIISKLAYNGFKFKRVTAASLRKIQGSEAVQKASSLTIISDQMDHFDEENHDMIDTMCAIAERGAQHIVIDNNTGKPEIYNFNYSLAVGKIGTIPGEALRSRCIEVFMHPSTDAEDKAWVGRAIHDVKPEVIGQLSGIMGNNLAYDLRDYIENNMFDLCSGLSRRERDKWLPLFSIAGMASKRWLERARNAQRRLKSDDNVKDSNEQLTEDRLKLMYDIVKKWSFEVIFGEELDEQINKFQEGSDGKVPPFNMYNRRSLLSKYNIKASNQRRGDIQKKGYKKSEFLGILGRYVVGTDGTDEIGV